MHLHRHLLFAIVPTLTATLCSAQNLIYEYDASNDPDGGTNSMWEPNVNNSDIHNSGTDYNRDLALTNVTYNPTPATNYSAITAAYTFDMASSTALTGTGSTASYGRDDLPLGGTSSNAAGASATVEVWLRPTASSLSNIGDQLIFESGGNTSGMHLAFVDQGSGVNLEFRTSVGNSDADAVALLTDDSLLNDFIQIVGVVDPNNAGDDDMRLFVNGVEVAGLDNWKAWQDGNNDAGLGSQSGSTGGGGFGTPFAGDIAIFRLYDYALTNDEIAALFAAGSAQVPEPTSIAIWSLLGLALAGFGYYRSRRKK